MAKINTTFGFTDNMTNPLKKIAEALKDTEGRFSKMQVAIISVNSAMQVFGQVKSVVSSVASKVTEMTSAYQYQAEQELKLETIMKQRMNASKADIQAIKELASAQQQLGIYGDEVILQGAQELASFTSNRQALETLIPAMNDLIAQQYGYSASGREFQSTADMMGKVLSGQTGALSRMGYIFSEEEKQLLKTGTEMERASTLAKIITDNVGHMNQALAGTEAGGIQNTRNLLSDLREESGKALMPLVSSFTNLEKVVQIELFKKLNQTLEWIVPIAQSLADALIKGFKVIMSFISPIINMLNGVMKVITRMSSFISEKIGQIGWIQKTFEGLFKAVQIGATAMGVIWIATHTKMLAVTIATSVKALAIWTANLIKLVAVHGVQMAKMAIQWIIGLGPVGWIIGGVILLITGLITLAIKLGNVFEKVGEVIGGVFNVMKTAGYNAIMFLYNLIVKLQNKMADSFIGQQFGIQKWQKAEYENISDAWESGKQKGGEIGAVLDEGLSNIVDKVKNFMGGGVNSKGEEMNFDSNGNLMVSDQSNAKIADNMEELVSEMARNKFSLNLNTLAPQVSMTNNINDKRGADYAINEFINALEKLSGAY